MKPFEYKHKSKLSEEREALTEEIADMIHNGEPIGVIIARDVGKKETILGILQKLAGKYIDDGDGIRASIALNEAKKLTEAS